MATLAELQTIRDANLGDTAPASPASPLRIPVCDRAVMDALLSEFYSPVINDIKNSTTTSLTVFSPSTGIEFDIKVSKTGNKVFLNGSITNKKGSNLASGDALVAIISPNYQEKTGLTQVITVIKRTGTTDLNTSTPLFIVANTIITSNIVANNEILIFNAVYFTND